MPREISLSARYRSGRKWLKLIKASLACRKSRRDLSKLTEDQLFDIGLSHDQVETELQRRIWDVPRHWQR